jgi:hypothetical protein
VALLERSQQLAASSIEGLGRFRILPKKKDVKRIGGPALRLNQTESDEFDSVLFGETTGAKRLGVQEFC